MIGINSSKLKDPCNNEAMNKERKEVKQVRTRDASGNWRANDNMQKPITHIKPNPQPLLESGFKQALETPASSASKPSSVPISMQSMNSSNPQHSNDYIYKNYEEFICILEPEFFHNKKLNPSQFVELLLPNTHYYIPDNYHKTQLFYEKILTQTNSIKFQYTMDPADKYKARYCKVRLLRVLTISDWGQEPGSPKDLVIEPNKVRKFNYWDYILAWRRAFFKQNNTFSLSYFFYFSNGFQYSTPYWFHKWWDDFGIDKNIVPLQIRQAYDNFITNIQLLEGYDTSPSWLIFCHNFQVPWIFMTEFHIKDETKDNYIVPVLIRRLKTKWWAKADLSRCDNLAIKSFFDNNPSLCKQSRQINNTTKDVFLEKKRQLLQKVAQWTSDSDMQEFIQELSAASNHGASSHHGSDADTDPFPQADDF